MAGDVCRCLGLSLSKGTYRHTGKLLPTEMRAIQKAPPSGGGVLFTGTESRLTLISEGGLYKLIMRSEKALARPFQDWVAYEVLPSIRKTGGYLINEEARPTAAVDSRSEFPMPSSFSDALRLLADEVERREACNLRPTTLGGTLKRYILTH